MPTTAAIPTEPLNGEEKWILIRIRNKQLFYILGSYIILTLVLVQAWGYDLEDLMSRKAVDLKRWGLFGPYFMVIIFLALTVFFIVYFYQAVYPYIKDIKGGKKEVVSFAPGLYKTPYFEEFFLETEIRKRKLIKVNRDLYEAAMNCGKAQVRLSPNARFIFSIESGGKFKKFNDANTVIEE